MISLTKGKRVFISGRHGVIKRKDWDMKLGGQVYAVTFDDGSTEKFEKKKLQTLVEEGMKTLENNAEAGALPEKSETVPPPKPNPPPKSPPSKPKEQIQPPKQPTSPPSLGKIATNDSDQTIQTPTLAAAKKNKNSKNLIAMFNKAVNDQKESREPKKPLQTKRKHSTGKLAGKVDMFNKQIQQEKQAATGRLCPANSDSDLPKSKSPPRSPIQREEPPTPPSPVPKAPPTAPEEIRRPPPAAPPAVPNSPPAGPTEIPKPPLASQSEVPKPPPAAPKEVPKQPPDAPIEVPKSPIAAPSEVPKPPPVAPKEIPKLPPDAPEEVSKPPPDAPKQAPKSPPAAPKAPPISPPRAPKAVPGPPPAAPKEPPSAPPTTLKQISPGPLNEVPSPTLPPTPPSTSERPPKPPVTPNATGAKSPSLSPMADLSIGGGEFPTPKTSDQESYLQSDKPPIPPPPMKQSKWECSMCCTENEISSKRCTMCLTENPHEKFKVGMTLKVEKQLVKILEIAVDGGDPVYLVELENGRRKEYSLSEIDSTLTAPIARRMTAPAPFARNRTPSGLPPPKKRPMQNKPQHRKSKSALIGDDDSDEFEEKLSKSYKPAQNKIATPPRSIPPPISPRHQTMPNVFAGPSGDSLKHVKKRIRYSRSSSPREPSMSGFSMPPEALTLSPEIPTALKKEHRPSIPNQVCLHLVIDKSGSMAGAKLTRLQEQIITLLKSGTYSTATFHIFDTEFHLLSDGLPAKNLVPFIDQIRASGGTDLQHAFEQSLEFIKKYNSQHPNSFNVLFFYTDCESTVDADILRQRYAELQSVVEERLETQLILVPPGDELTFSLLSNIFENNFMARDGSEIESIHHEIAMKTENFKKIQAKTKEIEITLENVEQTQQMVTTFQESTEALNDRFEKATVSTREIQSRFDELQAEAEELERLMEASRGDTEALVILEEEVRKKADECKEVKQRLDTATEEYLEILVQVDQNQTWRAEVDASIKRADQDAKKLAKEIRAAGALLDDAGFELPWWRKYFLGLTKRFQYFTSVAASLLARIRTNVESLNVLFREAKSQHEINENLQEQMRQCMENLMHVMDEIVEETC